MQNLTKLLGGMTLLIPGITTTAGNSEKQTSPNIILIFCDDLGYGDLSCYGATQYKTPNLDKMANKGIRFTNFLSAQAVCTASRAGLLTGCYPNRLGLSGALFPGSKIGLNPEEETIAEVLKSKNYKTAVFGKWHLGDKREFLPLQQGFDEYLGLPYSNDMWPVNFDGTPFSESRRDKNNKFPPLPLIEGNEQIKEIRTLEDQAMLTTILTERSVKFIAENKKNPFFLYLAHPMPHVPLAASAKFKGKSEQGLYGDVIMEIDWSVGEILKALEKNGLDKNTLVIFTSDNGPWLNFGNHAGSSGGLREGKGTTFEGGQRVPCIMKWPGVIKEGEICNKLASTIDVLPSLAAITGSKLPEKKIDGVNIYGLLTGQEDAEPRKEFFYYYRANSLQSVTDGKWKLIFEHDGRTYHGYKPGDNGYPGGTKENFRHQLALYDLRRDPGEQYDVKEFYPEIVARLNEIAEKARNDLGDDIRKIKGINRREPGGLAE